MCSLPHVFLPNLPNMFFLSVATSEMMFVILFIHIYLICDNSLLAQECILFSGDQNLWENMMPV